MPTDLYKFRKNFYSQYGEDGIIAKIFDVLKIKKGWCVEFGAWDGIHLSNTYHLIKDWGWHGILIEANKKKFLELAKNFAMTETTCLNSYIEATGKNSLGHILSKTAVPKNFDLLSIDIDGNDYYIWKNLKTYWPKLVIIEFNPTIPLEVEFIQPFGKKINQGTSLSAMNKLAMSKKYSLIAVTGSNAFFIRHKYLPELKIQNTDPAIVWVERKKSLTHFFQLYDGSVVIRGNRLLCWHGIKIEDKNVQIIPHPFRHFPASKLDTLGSLVCLGNWGQLWKALKEKLIKSKLFKLLLWFRYTRGIGLTKGIANPSSTKTKQRFIKQTADKNNINTLIETGTYLGDMVQANLGVFAKIYSIELDEKLYERAKKRFREYKHIKIIHGDSSLVLKKITGQSLDKSLFWLDAHYSGGITAKGKKETPIEGELKTILNRWKKGSVIIIDDARLFTGRNGFPKLEIINKMAGSKKLKVNVIRDMITIK